MLGVSPNAPMDVVTRQVSTNGVTDSRLTHCRAKKPVIQRLHPDRSLGDSQAAARFAEFMAIYRETVETEEKRQAYSNIKTSDELQKLIKRTKQLTMGAAS